MEFNQHTRDSLRIQEEDILVVEIENLKKKQYDAAATEDYINAAKFKDEVTALQIRLDKLRQEREARWLKAEIPFTKGFNIHQSGKNLQGISRGDTQTRLNELNSLLKLDIPCVLDDFDEKVIEIHKSETKTPISPPPQRKTFSAQPLYNKEKEKNIEKDKESNSFSNYPVNNNNSNNSSFFGAVNSSPILPKSRLFRVSQNLKKKITQKELKFLKHSLF